MNKDADVIRFDPSKEEEVDEPPQETTETKTKTKAQVSDETKAGGKTDKDKNVSNLNLLVR